MATGYTQVLVEKPETTFPAFAMRCARAFGACIEMRDDALDVPPPAKVEPSTYHRDQLEKAYAAMRELEVMPLEEADRRAEADYQRQLQGKKESQERHARETATFNAMLEKVMSWEPPTDDHKGLKKFMVEQIEMSTTRPYDWPVHRASAQGWLELAKENAAEDIRRHAEGWSKDQENARKATEWLAALRNSLVRCP